MDPFVLTHQQRSLGACLARQAADRPDHPFLVYGGRTWTYREFDEWVSRVAAGLAQLGLRKGDKLALMLPNCAEFMALWFACARIGLVEVTLNTAYRGPLLRHVIENSDSRMAVVADDYVERFQHETVGFGKLEKMIVWSRGTPGVHDLPIPVQPFEVLTDHDAPMPIVEVSNLDPLAIMYSSGTTGPSKGVCCPQAQMFWWGVYSARALGIREGDVLLTTLPLFHTNALNAFYQALVNGCTYVLEPKFSASRFWARVRESRATVSYLLGAMAAILIAQPETEDDRAHGLRVALGGGVPAPHHAVFHARFGVPLVDGYASTETNFVFASPIPSDRPGGMGRLMEGAEALIVDADDAPLPDGEAGELLLRPTEPHSFASGYFGMPDKTVEAWQNLWFHTGDRVVREPDGHYRFIDRMKDAIRRRGENVSAWEVEQVLSGHPAVAACAAYPLPSELGEDEVAVAVQLEPGAALVPEEVVAHCEGRLAAFAVPRFVRFVAEMPLTENGKVKKVALRAAGVTADIWDRGPGGPRNSTRRGVRPAGSGATR